MTPDDTTLVVSNGADGTISTIDLTGLKAIRTTSVASLPSLPQQCGQPIPYAVAATSSNKAIIALTCPNVTEGQLMVLDLATQATGCGGSKGCSAMLAAFPQNTSQALNVTGGAKGDLILVTNGGTMGLWNVKTDAFVARGVGGVLQHPVAHTAMAGDGTAVALFYGAFDVSLLETSIMQDVDYLGSGVNDVHSLAGEKLDASGALLYYPETFGFSIYDVHQGHEKRRVALTQTTAATIDALAIDETGLRVFLLTGTGLTVVDLGEAPLSIGNVQPAQGSASGGTKVVVRGSGFAGGAQVFFNKHAAGVQFVDSSTLNVTSPATAAGSLRLTVVNPDGSEYSLDDSYTAH